MGEATRSLWFVRGGWQGSRDDLIAIASQLDTYVDSVAVRITTRSGAQEFTSTDFAAVATPARLKKSTQIQFEGRSAATSIDVQLVRRRTSVKDGVAVAGVFANFQAMNDEGVEVTERARNAIGLTFDVGADPLSRKEVSGNELSDYATLWKSVTDDRIFLLGAIAFGLVLVPLLVATLIHGYLEPGKSTLGDVILFCGCNRSLLWGLPFLVAGMFAFLNHALPAIDIGDKPPWRRLAAPLTKVGGASYVVAAVAKGVFS